MNKTIAIVFTLILNCSIILTNGEAQDTLLRYFPISHVSGPDTEGKFEAEIYYGIEEGLETGQKGIAYSRYEELDTGKMYLIGKAEILEPDVLSSIIQIDPLIPGHSPKPVIGDLIAMEVIYHSLAFNNEITKVYLLNISLTNVMGDPFLKWDDLFNDPELKSERILTLMLDDLEFTAVEMRKQMEDIRIETGDYVDLMLFDVMESSSRQDLLEFFKYISARPKKYLGHQWKLSEIFATWLVSSAPRVIKKQ